MPGGAGLGLPQRLAVKLAYLPHHRRKDQRGARQQDKAQDKNSWIYKYHNMERIEYEKVQFTEDTVIPELPAPKDRLKEPLKSDFERVMADQDRLI